MSLLRIGHELRELLLLRRIDRDRAARRSRHRRRRRRPSLRRLLRPDVRRIARARRRAPAVRHASARRRPTLASDSRYPRCPRWTRTSPADVGGVGAFAAAEVLAQPWPNCFTSFSMSFISCSLRSPCTEISMLELLSSDRWTPGRRGNGSSRKVASASRCADNVTVSPSFVTMLSSPLASRWAFARRRGVASAAFWPLLAGVFSFSSLARRAGSSAIRFRETMVHPPSGVKVARRAAQSPRCPHGNLERAFRAPKAPRVATARPGSGGLGLVVRRPAASASRRRASSTGFGESSCPPPGHFSRSPDMAFAVSATIGVRRPEACSCGGSRASPRNRPSRIWRSMKITS